MDNNKKKNIYFEVIVLLNSYRNALSHQLKQIVLVKLVQPNCHFTSFNEHTELQPTSSAFSHSTTLVNIDIFKKKTPQMILPGWWRRVRSLASVSSVSLALETWLLFQLHRTCTQLIAATAGPTYRSLNDPSAAHSLNWRRAAQHTKSKCNCVKRKRWSRF